MEQLRKSEDAMSIKAIACVLFFWTGIPGVIGVVVAILALIKPADSNGNILV